MMKKLFLITLLTAAFFTITSCKSDDDGDLEATLTGGTWKLIRLSINNEDVTSTELDDCDLKDTYVFNDNNTFIYTSNETQNGTCVNGTSNGIWEEDNSVPNSIRFVAAFDGDDINDPNEQLNFILQDKLLREVVLEPISSGGFDTYNYSYEKQ